MRISSRVLPLSALLIALLWACTDDSPSETTATTDDTPAQAATTANTSSAESNRTAGFSQDRNPYFGDLHVHTMYSFDAFIFGTTSSPDDAYRFAKGGTIIHPAGFEMKLDLPLDFYAVTDHAFYLGVLREMADPTTEISKHEVAQGMTTLSDAVNRRSVFSRIRTFMRTDRGMEIMDYDIVKSAWADIVASANRNNDPGNFTAFVAYEYTSSGPASENLHRNVIFRGDAAPEIPYSRLDSTNPEDLWAWMDEQRAAGIESLAIPHNSNGSDGWMFPLKDWSGAPLDSAYADQRMRNEPLVEITQVKGTSDTHPALSPNDEWADFEIMPYRIATRLNSRPQGSYVREALMNGIEMQANEDFNPYKFGVIGSSDTHNASYAGDEDNYWSKVGILDADGQLRGAVPLDEPGEDGNLYLDTYYNTWGASGLAGVWAEENTRESIYDSFRRKETFGTSGPRMKVRFFAGYDLPDIDDADMISKAYAGGVAMGGDLISDAGREPSFLVWAAKDANSAPLQRLQVIKGWVEDGKSMEQVYDVACADGGEVDPSTHRCPDNGAVVDITDCSISQGLGAAELKTAWRDPSYDASQHALYYVRALENPTCRWSTWDAIRAGVAPREGMHSTIQERVWSSPIWITPAD